jgi:tetratricopeptide (TPR) repeat protein
LLPADDHRALSAMPSLGAALYYGGQLDRALGFLDGALARASEAGAGIVADRVAILRALVRTHVDPSFGMRPALAELERRVASLAATGDDLGLAEGWSTVGVLRFWLGDGAGALEAIERGHDHAERAGSQRLLQLTSSEMMGPFVWGPTPADEVLERASALLAELQAAGSDSFELSLCLAVAHAMRGEIELSDRWIERALTRARELGERLHLAAGHPHLEAWMILGRYAETEQQASGGIEQLRAMGEQGYLSTSLIYLAEAIVSQGRPDEADVALREAEALAGEDDAVDVIGTRRVRAKILHREGRLDDAERFARDAVAFGGATDYLVETASSHRELGEILLAKGAREEGVEHLRAALELLERKGVLVMLGPLRARIAEAEAAP